jgi:hypothetical protein
MRGFLRPLGPLTVLAVTVLSSPALAQSPSFALKAVGAATNGYYVFGAAPGEVIEGRVRIVNAGKVAGTARLDVVDATTGATTGAVYETVGKRSADVGAWVRLASPRVTLGPGDSAIVGFTVTVPEDARRGEHLGGIVAAPVEAAAREGDGDGQRTFRVNVVNQSVLAVQVNLPGEARQLLKVRGVEAGGNTGYQTLRITLSNPGERMVKGTGVVEITRGGDVVARQRFLIDTFLPRTRIDYPVVMRGRALVPGSYRARVTLDWGAGKIAEAYAFDVSRKNIEQAFGSEGLAQLDDTSSGGGGIALPLIAGILALLLGIGGSVLYFRRHTRRLEERIMRRHAEADEPRFSAQEDRESSRR